MPKTIYELFNNKSEDDINRMICILNDSDKKLLLDRYGSDLHYPVITSVWNSIKSQRYYSYLVPKMRKILDNGIDYDEVIYKILCNSNRTNQELCEMLKIDRKTLYDSLTRLKNNGKKYQRKYYSNGMIQYNAIKDYKTLKRENDVSSTIITDSEENKIRVLLISDLHFGNEKERRKLVDKAFNYCIKRGIHIIICTGDFIDGTFSRGNILIKDAMNQLEYICQKYPYDKSILTFGVGGDHDLSILERDGIDFNEYIRNNRHDIIINGYGNSDINIKNDKFHLYHHLENIKLVPNDAHLIIHGHSHQYKFYLKDNVANILVPSLSGISNLPSVLELTGDFKSGYFKNGLLKHLYLEKSDILLSETYFDFLDRPINPGTFVMNNIEDFAWDDSVYKSEFEGNGFKEHKLILKK